MALLTKAEILGAQDRKHEVVAVPEWGGDVQVWEMSGSCRDRYELLLMNLADKDPTKRLAVENLRATLLAGSICDEQGQPLFSEADIVALGSKNYMVLDRIKDVAEKLNAITAEDKAEIAKNSETQGSGETGESQ